LLIFIAKKAQEKRISIQDDMLYISILEIFNANDTNCLIFN